MSSWTNKRPIDAKNATPFQLRTLRKFVGVKTDEDAVNYALALGVDVGKRVATQVKRAYATIADLYNAKIEYEQEIAERAAEIEREKAQELARVRRNATKKLKRAKRRAIEKLAKSPLVAALKRRLAKPELVSVDEVGTIRFYRKKRITYKNITSMRDFYEAIKTAIPKYLRTTQFVSFHITDDNNTRVRSHSLRLTDLETFQDFEAGVDLILSGNFVGSDPLNQETEKLDMNHFDLSATLIAGGFGAARKMMFKTKGIESSTFEKNGKKILVGDCGWQCIKHLITPLIKNKGEYEIDFKQFQTLAGIQEFIAKERLNIRIYGNGFTLNRPHTEIVRDGEQKVFMIPDKKRKGMVRKHIGSTFNVRTDITPTVIAPGLDKYITNPLPWETRQLEEGGEYHVFRDGKPYTLTPEEQKIDAEWVPIYYRPRYLGAIIYDEVNEHFDVAEEQSIGAERTMILEDDVYLSLESNVIKNDEIIFSPRQINTNNRQHAKVKSSFIFFDYETVIDFKQNSCMAEYSLSILVLGEKELDCLALADLEGRKHTVEEIREKCCVTFLGYDCSKQFIKWLLKNEMDTHFTLVGFNNSNFDNFILLSALLQHDGFEEIPISDIFYNGSQLFNFKISHRHEFFDIAKHLMGSLANNCKSFKVNCCAKKSFNHDLAQTLHEDGKLIDYITGNEKLKEYNEFDVLATAVLFHKYRAALEAIPATKPYAKDLHKTKTIGSLIYKVFDANCTAKGLTFPKLSYEQYSDLQKYKVAGRVELFNGIQKVTERLASTDVCSLYPYVMAVLNVYYPCGEIEETERYMGDDTIGFYYCDIDQSNLGPNNLPLIYPKKSETENSWDHTEVLKDYLISNVIITLLKRHGCSVVIKKGFYFTKTVKSCEMFGFLLDLMKAKNEQDSLKKVAPKACPYAAKEKAVEEAAAAFKLAVNSKDEEAAIAAHEELQRIKNKPIEVGTEASYNPALRETLKLLMNSLSGKVIEGLHTEKTTSVDSLVEYEKLCKSSVKINCINNIGNKLFVTYDTDPMKLCAKSQRPIFLGVLIYDYAKSYMFNNSYSKVGRDKLLYTDTDASKMRYSDFTEWRKWAEKTVVPHWKEVEKVDPRYEAHPIYDPNSKVFGSFEDELEGMEGENYTFYALQKKSWCYIVDSEEKYRFKGLNDRSIVMTGDEPFLEHKTRAGLEVVKIAPSKAKEVWKYAVDHQSDSLGAGNAGKFFEQLYTDKKAHLLCCSFRKIVKNNLRNVESNETERFNKSMNRVQVNYMLKTVKI
jgi:hypothetical protein